MTPQEIQNLVAGINKNFGTMFGFPEGFVTAKIRPYGFDLTINGRDVDFNTNGVDIGSGSFLNKKFTIQEII